MFKEKVNKYQEETKEFINKWEEKSREFIHNFLDNFGNSTNMIKEHVQKAMSPRPSRKSASTSSSTSKLSFSLLRNLRQGRKRRNSNSQVPSSSSGTNLNGKRPLSEDQSANSKRIRSSDNLFSKSNDNQISSDEEESEDECVTSHVSNRNSKRNSSASSAIKKSAKNFDDLEDVDDDVDNQIPLI